MILLLAACGKTDDVVTKPRGQPSATDWAAQREAMVKLTIENRGVSNARLLAAMREVRRHLFVPVPVRVDAYRDTALRIGYEQTISQPYIVAVMTDEAAVGPGERVLEIGTGSGYGAAVLAKLAGEVYTIEILEPLGLEAEKRLKKLGYDNVHVRIGDGYKGWPEKAPFDAILVTAAPPRVPEPLKRQLKVGGRLVLPVGPVDSVQRLRVIERTEEGFVERPLFRVRFVPMVGEALK